ncbi:MAG: IS200/IS605 family transposase [Candidatus Woesearchaeota archaeon]|nr:IS200/IS605 family transposase [Candidatus Woesearchaeota archaeon]
MSELMHLSRSVGQSNYHLIWKPKWCHPILTGSVRRCCVAALRRAAARHGIRLLEMEVMPDHIHVFVELKPSMSVSNAFQLLKGYSSRMLFEHFPNLRRRFRTGHLWSPGKFFRSVGAVTADAIQRYIAESNRGSRQQQQLTRYPGL